MNYYLLHFISFQCIIDLEIILLFEMWKKLELIF